MNQYFPPLTPKKFRLTWTWPTTGDKVYTSPYGHGGNTLEEAQAEAAHMERIGYTDVRVIE